jgi:hypothetical protein
MSRWVSEQAFADELRVTDNTVTVMADVRLKSFIL